MRAPGRPVVRSSNLNIFQNIKINVPSEPRIDTYLLENEKKALKPQSQATFAIAKLQYLFRISQSAILFQSMSDGYMSRAVRGIYNMLDARLAS